MYTAGVGGMLRGGGGDGGFKDVDEEEGVAGVEEGGGEDLADEAAGAGYGYMHCRCECVVVYAGGCCCVWW